MTTQLDLISAVPSVYSEMRPFYEHPPYLPPEIRWWVQNFSRLYIGAEYCTNETIGNVDGDVGLIGRMSLPAPIPSESNGTATVITATPMASFGTPDGTQTGDVTDVPEVRWYRMAWADESTAPVNIAQGDSALWVRDARSSAQAFPIGGFGGLSDAVPVEISGSTTVVEISTINWTVPSDYPVTHAYIFVSDTEDGPFFRWVGKLEYDPVTGDWTPLYDTLSFEVISARFTHINQYIAMPTFKGACRWGLRFVGFTSHDSFLTTEDHDVYFSVIQGSKRVALVDENGDPLAEEKVWPRWVEQDGGMLRIEGFPEGYGIDQIDADPNLRQIAYLTTPYQGPSDPAAEGRVVGTNLLFIGMANQQQQEQVQSPFIVNGFGEFEGAITAVRAEQRGDVLLIYTQSGVFSLRGLAFVELPQVEAVFTGVFTPLSKSYGCIGPTAIADSPMGVFTLTSSTVVLTTSAGVQDVASDAIRDWIRTRQTSAKQQAVMAFDMTRNLLFTVIGGDCLVLDFDNMAWTVWEGGNWRYVCVADGREVGLTTIGAGSKVLFQDISGDVVLLDENMLCDKGLPGEAHFAQVVGFTGTPATMVDYESDGAGEVVIETTGAHSFAPGDFVSQVVTTPAGLNGTFEVVTVPTSTSYEITLVLPITASPVAIVGGTATPYDDEIIVDGISNVSLRGVEVKIFVGASEGSTAIVTGAVAGSAPDTWDVSVGAWGSGMPTVGDWVAFAPIRFRYQTGAIPPVKTPSHRITATRLVMHEDVSSTFSPQTYIGISTFGGGEPADVTGDNTPTSHRTMRLAQARTSKDIAVPLSATTRRVVFGVDFLQPPSDRIRINSMEIITDEPESRTP